MKFFIYLLVPIGVFGAQIKHWKEYSTKLEIPANSQQPPKKDQEPLNANVVKFFFYTKSKPQAPLLIENNDVGPLAASGLYNASRRTVFVIHGWINDHKSQVNSLIKPALLHHDYNVFVVDWSPVSRQNYVKAARSVARVGALVGDFVNALMMRYNQTGAAFTLIGHSLGAHVAGGAGAATLDPVDQIVGLDPAGPLFNYVNTGLRLSSKQASYVQVIHTNAYTLGCASSLGHVDFFPNGGMMQSGCNVSGPKVCSHSRAYEFLAEAIRMGSKFVAVKCNDYVDFQDGKCKGNERALMGQLEPDKRSTGEFYLDTNPKPPFAKG